MKKSRVHELRYPIGLFSTPLSYLNVDTRKSVGVLRDFHSILVNEISGLSKDDLEWTYRPDGWSIKQVIHHLADSHMTALQRIKLALTENQPNIIGYREDEWARLSDVVDVDIGASLSILDGVHQRMCAVFSNMSDLDYNKTYYHLEAQKSFSLYEVLALYDWHSCHHLEHIRNAKTFKSKYQS